MKSKLAIVLLSCISFSALADVYTSSIDVYKKDNQGDNKLLYNITSVQVDQKKSSVYSLKDIKSQGETLKEGFVYNSSIEKDKSNEDLAVLSFNLSLNELIKNPDSNAKEEYFNNGFNTSQKLLINNDYSKDLNFPPYTIKVKVQKQ